MCCQLRIFVKLGDDALVYQTDIIKLGYCVDIIWQFTLHLARHWHLLSLLCITIVICILKLAITYISDKGDMGNWSVLCPPITHVPLLLLFP